MSTFSFLVRATVYILAFVVSWYAMSAVHYEKFLKQGHVNQAQVLYFLLVFGLAYLVGSFAMIFINI